MAFVAILAAAGVGAVSMLVFVGLMVLAQLFLSDKIALSAMGARDVSPEQFIERLG